MGASTTSADRDPELTATVLSRTPMRFAGGADRTSDRPAHVRAGSGLVAIGGLLVIVQDDSNFVALVGPDRPGAARAVALPRGEDGARQFGDSRGNKALKLDLEACVADPAGRLVAFGSGSARRREVALVIDAVATEAPRVRVVAAHALFSRLREAPAFAGSELNVEGAVLVGETVRLFTRGNGAVRDGRAPVNASCDLSWPELSRHLDAPGSHPPPTPTRIRPFALGALDGTPLGFTDATAWDHRVLFTAAAEDSPDAVRDGTVTGSVIGIIGERDTRWTPIVDRDGRPLPDKIEGILVADGTAGEVWTVADPDDERRPSELWRVRLDGPWRVDRVSREG